MGIEKEPASREPRRDVSLREDVQLAGSRARCPYCHAEVGAPGERWVACGVCLARHHEGCWKESRSCATCRSPAFLSRGRRLEPWLVLAALLVLAAPVALALAL